MANRSSVDGEFAPRSRSESTYIVKRKYLVEGVEFVKVGYLPVRAGTENGKVKPSILHKPSLPLMLKHARS